MIEIIKPWALCNGYVPDIPKAAGRLETDREMEKPSIDVVTYRRSNQCKSRIEIKGFYGLGGDAYIDSNKRLIEKWSMTYITYELHPSFDAFQETFRLEFPFWELLENFYKKILKDLDQWKAQQKNLNEIEPDTKSGEVSLNWIKVTEAPKDETTIYVAREWP